jgi:hypothetical protein
MDNLSINPPKALGRQVISINYLYDAASGTYRPMQAGDAGTNTKQGVVNTTDTTLVSGNFSAIQILEDATFSTFGETDAEGDEITSIEFPAGFVIFGNITGYALSAGAVRAYRG